MEAGTLIKATISRAVVRLDRPDNGCTDAYPARLVGLSAELWAGVLVIRDCRPHLSRSDDVAAADSVAE
jgi:hypothetical protein